MTQLITPEVIPELENVTSSQLVDLPEDLIFPDPELWSDEPPLESDLHRSQIDNFIRLLQWIFSPGGIGGRSDVYAAGNLTVYYSPNQKKSEFFRGPDIFLVKETDPKSRKSWVVWHEDGKYPNLIIELLSASTADTDRTTKKEIYQSVWRVPEYFWFDPYSLEFQGFRLIGGKYEALELNDRGHLWSEELGFYLGIENRKLRLFLPGGSIIPMPEEAEAERARQAEERAEQAEIQLEVERNRSIALAEKLRELGIDPSQIGEIL